jgi:hypothetical protein
MDLLANIAAAAAPASLPALRRSEPSPTDSCNAIKGRPSPQASSDVDEESDGEESQVDSLGSSYYSSDEDEEDRHSSSEEESEEE